MVIAWRDEELLPTQGRPAPRSALWSSFDRTALKLFLVTFGPGQSVAANVLTVAVIAVAGYRCAGSPLVPDVCCFCVTPAPVAGTS